MEYMLPEVRQQSKAWFMPTTQQKITLEEEIDFYFFLPCVGS